MFSPLNEVAGSQLEDIGSVEALPVGSEVDLFEGGALAETGVVEQVLASTVVAFFPFCLYEGGKDFVGAGGLQCAACQGGLIGMSHAVQSQLSEQIEGGRSGDHDISLVNE